MSTILTTLDQLEARAFAEAQRTHQPCDIEYDRHESVAVLRLAGVTYMAALPVVGGAA